VAKHVAVPILERILDEGFAPVRYRLIEPGPAELDDLYRANIDEIWHTYRYRALDRLFEFGPSLVVLLHDVSSRAAGEGHSRLMELKGSGDLHALPPTTLRRTFGAVNVMLSLMHSSRTPDDARAETRILFRKWLLSGEEDDVEADVEQIPLLDFARLLQASRGHETRDFDDCLSAFRARLVTMLWELFDDEGRGRAAELGVTGGLAEPGVGRVLSRHLHGADPALADALECDFEPGRVTIAPERIWRLIGGYGASLDGWERLVLGSSAYFKPFRKHDRERASVGVSAETMG
jgi:hypothetical protein